VNQKETTDTPRLKS